MSRRRRAVKRETKPDFKYNSEVVHNFVNNVMKSGKKSVAERIVYGAFDIVQEKTKESDVLKVFQKALDNVKPVLEVRSRRVGGATYQVPVEIPSDRRATLAMRWIISFARARKGGSMEEHLAAELLDAFNGQGSAIKKKEDTHKMAEANRAFAHYKW